MPITKSQLDYWNGSAWVTAETPAENNALIRFTLDDKMGQAAACTVKVSNKFNNPFSASADDYKGKLSGVFTDFQKIRVLDSGTKVVLFYGRIYKTREKYDMQFGNVIEIEAMDALAELKDNVTDGHDDITITTSGTTYPTPASPATAAGKRSGLIKGFISLFSKSGNITFTGDGDRFEESNTSFSKAGTYPLQKGGQKSALAHINAVAKDDPHSSTKKVLTYDYYVDPNFQSRAVDHEPAAFFNYFPRGDRPADSNISGAVVATHALRIEYPTGGGLTKTGRVLPMMADYDFSRPKSELYTDAVCHYVDEGPDTVAGAANKDKGWDIEEKTAKLELVKIKTISGSFVWDGKAIGGPTSACGTDATEEIISGSTVVGRIQFMSATSGGTDADPEYALISHATNDFPSTGTITGASSTSSSFVIISRLRDTYGINKTARLGATNIDNANVIREQAVSRLRRSSDPIIRGRVRVMQKPWYYLDSSSTTVSSNTITFGDLNPLIYGFRVGMTINKVSSTGVTQSYGYATAVTSNSITVGNAMSESISSGDTIRLYIPVRASDSCYIINRLVNITGGDFQITEVNYTEDNGVVSSEIEVVGSDSGLGPPQNSVSRLISEVSEKENYTQPTAQSAKVKFTSKFSHHSSNKHTTIAWTAGQLTVGSNAYPISAGTSSFGSATEYYLYYPGSGTGFTSSTVASYTTDKDQTVVCWVNVLSTSDSSQWLEFKPMVDLNFSVPDMGSAGNLINQRTIVPTGKLTSESMEYFNADVVFKATGDNVIAYNPAGSVVSSFPVTFADGTSVTIASISNPAFTLAGNAGIDHFIYIDTANTSLNITTTYSAAVGDTKLIVATCERVPGYDALVFGTNSAASGGMSIVNKNINSTGLIGDLKQGAVTLSNDIYFRTGTSGSNRVEIVANGIKGLDSSNTEQFTLNAANGKGTFGENSCTLDSYGLTLGVQGSGGDDEFIRINSQVANSTANFRIQSYIDNLLIMFSGGHYLLPGVGASHGILGSDGHRWRELWLGPTSGTSPGTEGLYLSGRLLRNNAGTLEWNGSEIGSGVSLSGTNTWSAVNTFSEELRGSKSSTTAPSIYAVYAPIQTNKGMWFGDESAPSAPNSGFIRLYSESGVLKYKNSSNTIVSLSGSGSVPDPLRLGNGVYNGPTYSFTTDTDTGMYLNSTTSLGFSTAGSTKMHLLITGNEMEINGHLDLNGYILYDFDECQARDSGSASDPTYTWGSYATSGMYYDSGVALSYGGNLKLKIRNTEIQVSDDIRPASSDSWWLGSSSLRFKRLYVVDATDVSSDAELKENLTPISNGLDFISSLSPITFNRKGVSEINFGFTAQAMKQAVLDAGYTEDMGVYSEEIDEDTGEIRWGISYETLVAPLVASIKELKERIEVLEGN